MDRLLVAAFTTFDAGTQGTIGYRAGLRLLLDE
jgi:hypothetical protein